VLIQIVEANGTLQPTHDFVKSDGASRWLGLLVFLIIVLLLLDRLLPQERDKPCLQGFVVPEILTSLIF
jgi:hypothetical protein